MQGVVAKSAPIWSIKEGHFVVVVKDKECIAYKESDFVYFRSIFAQWLFINFERNLACFLFCLFLIPLYNS